MGKSKDLYLELMQEHYNNEDEDYQYEEWLQNQRRQQETGVEEKFFPKRSTNTKKNKNGLEVI